jgi:hypothetical protein
MVLIGMYRANDGKAMTALKEFASLTEVVAVYVRAEWKVG